jgi:hypothetical protein
MPGRCRTTEMLRTTAGSGLLTCEEDAVVKEGCHARG